MTAAMAGQSILAEVPTCRVGRPSTASASMEQHSNLALRRVLAGTHCRRGSNSLLLSRSHQMVSASSGLQDSSEACPATRFGQRLQGSPTLCTRTRYGKTHQLDGRLGLNSRLPGSSLRQSAGDVQMSLANHSTESKQADKEAAAGAEGNGVASGDTEAVDLSAVVEWELDFCSRPLVDERGKRVWELLVCDASRQLQYAEFFPSNKINSATLKDAIMRVCEANGAPKPQKIRFFRAQMQTIISKACAELDIQSVPSQRCVTLVRWLEERLEEVYKRDPSFQAGAAPLLQLEPPPPQDLPDTLRGEQWAFVQLPLSAILEETARVQDGEMFGSSMNLEAVGLGGLRPTDMIPGISVQSSRATPLAAWTSALELAHLRVDTSRACLLLSTGVSDTWRYAFYRKSSTADAEARAWEEAKRQCGGLHFLAVQRDLEEEDCTGFWMLHDTLPPSF